MRRLLTALGITALGAARITAAARGVCCVAAGPEKLIRGPPWVALLPKARKSRILAMISFLIAKPELFGCSASQSLSGIV